MRLAVILATALGLSAAHAAEPIRIGITTILSGPIADRGQSEQYGAQLAMDRINEAGGVLGRPLEAYYGDNACKPEIGVPATQRLLERVHVPVIIGALCTPVTHAIMPIMAQAKVPLVIATSAGQDFVDASGVGGNDYAFKTIGSDLDIGRGTIAYLKSKGVKSIAVLGDGLEFLATGARSTAKAARDAGMVVTSETILPEKGADLAASLKTMLDGKPDTLVVVLGPSNAAFFKAYEAAGTRIPVSGRMDINGALNAVSPAFRESGALSGITSAGVFSPLIPAAPVQDFIAAYRARTGLTPTQRSFFVYEAVYLVADAINRAGTDTPGAIEAALKSTEMPSILGGSYKMDDHNHPHLPIFITGLKDGKPAVIATE